MCSILSLAINVYYSTYKLVVISSPVDPSSIPLYLLAHAVHSYTVTQHLWVTSGLYIVSLVQFCLNGSLVFAVNVSV